jgi:polyisoprenoid-binding protein YceI
MTATIAPQETGTSTWTVDQAHTSAEFAVKHLMITTTKGRFGTVAGTVVIDEENPSRSTVDVTIDATTIDTREEKRDAHLRSPDFFDVEHYPTLHFVSTRVEGDINGSFTLVGQLTIRDVTRDVVLKAANEGRVRDPWGGERAAFSAKGVIKRSDWGLTWNMALETGGVVVSDEVKISLDVELLRA